MHARRAIGLVLTLGLLIGGVPFTWGAEAPEAQNDSVGVAPPRLSFTDGNVSFYRPGASDWVQAQINTPLAPGDQLYAGTPGSLELQVGGRAFVRAWANAQIGLENQEPDFLQFRLTAGRATFDLRTVESGRTVEVNTPNAAITFEHPGYYRVEVGGDRTVLVVRRSGRAAVTLPSGEAVAVSPSEEAIVEGATTPRISSFAAPPLDEWDKWNYARTDALLDAVSARYVSPGIYGVDDLDHHGAWRIVDPYGPVWVPTGMPTGWVPYSTGSWVLDPLYGWTWVDTAPWGWAPYHHGRWVFVNGFWGWAPGPPVHRPVYAPALVAFLNGPGVRIGIGGPIVGWVALGWGEPCIPWWGRPGFAHRPWWGGWGGPRVVNNVGVQRTTLVSAEQITAYHNAQLRNAVVAVNEDRFGHGRVAPARLTLEETRALLPTHAAPRIIPGADHFVPTERRGIRPPDEALHRPVVATRSPQHPREVEAAGGPRRSPVGVSVPAPHLVAPPARPEAASNLARPPFGQSAVERPMTDRRVTPPPQRPESRPGQPGADVPPAATRQAPPQPSAVKAVTPASPAGRPEAPASRPQPGATPRPEQLPAASVAVPRQAAPQPRPEVKAAAPAAAAHAAPAPRPEVTRPTATPSQAPAVQRQETQPRPERSATSPAATQRQASPPPRAEAAKPAARPLPGEPANRLSPNRSEARSRPEASRQEASPQKPSQEKPANGPRGHQGG